MSDVTRAIKRLPCISVAAIDGAQSSLIARSILSNSRRSDDLPYKQFYHFHRLILHSIFLQVLL